MGLAGAFTDRSQQKQVLAAVEQIMTSDNNLSTWETTLLSELRLKFRREHGVENTAEIQRRQKVALSRNPTVQMNRQGALKSGFFVCLQRRTSSPAVEPARLARWKTARQSNAPDVFESP